MPVYEYRCKECSRKFTVLVGIIANATPPECPGCGSGAAVRIMSRFASPKGDAERLERVGDPRNTPGGENLAGLRDWMGRLGSELGEEGREMRDALEEVMADESETGAGDNGFDEETVAESAPTEKHSDDRFSGSLSSL